jgi:hypothetical protein
MINYEVAMRMITLILWVLGAVWSLFMIIENNKYFNIRKDEEKNTLACNLLAWIVLMVLSIIRVVKVIH